MVTPYGITVYPIWLPHTVLPHMGRTFGIRNEVECLSNQMHPSNPIEDSIIKISIGDDLESFSRYLNEGILEYRRCNPEICYSHHFFEISDVDLIQVPIYRNMKKLSEREIDWEKRFVVSFCVRKTVWLSRVQNQTIHDIYYPNCN